MQELLRVRSSRQQRGVGRQGVTASVDCAYCNLVITLTVKCRPSFLSVAPHNSDGRSAALSPTAVCGQFRHALVKLRILTQVHGVADTTAMSHRQSLELVLLA